MAATSTQMIVGGGTSQVDPHFRFAHVDGRYTSTGQLGSGRFDDGDFGSTAITFTRSDGMTLTGSITPTAPGDCGATGPGVSCFRVDLVGTADIASAHLLMAVPASALNAPTNTFLLSGTLTLRRTIGYELLDVNGAAYAFGGVAPVVGSNAPGAARIELTRSGNGCWIVTNAGRVSTFGDAPAFGSANPAVLSGGDTVTSLSATPSGKGYWLFTTKGRVLPFGDARFLGDLHTTRLNGGIVGSIATPTGKGYYMVATDGGVFAFGDARFRGSMGRVRLNKPIVGLVPTADNAGYWLVASDGGVFTFNAPFHGSMGAVTLNRPIVAMVAYSDAYLMIASDGGVFNFSNGPFFGSDAGASLPESIVSGASAN